MASKILGVMSGSSLYGLDLAICQFQVDHFSLLHTDSVPFSDEIVQRLKDPLAQSSRMFIELEAEFSKFVALQINQFLIDSATEIDLIVSHGHTIYHVPENLISCQIGNGGIIASKTGVDTLCDLRIQDVSLGGQGAPLASLVDQYLFNDYALRLNLGGIANLSVTSEGKLRSWDVCPCNQVLNHLAGLMGFAYDDKGTIARQGKMDEDLYAQWQMLEYFKQLPPKSLDNYWVRNNFISKLKDQKIEAAMNTACHFIADRISMDIQQHLPKGKHKMLITGGGAHNDYLVECIEKVTNLEIVIPEPSIIDFKEAMLMAYMGHRYLINKANVLSSATGSRKDIIAGAYYKGNG